MISIQLILHKDKASRNTKKNLLTVASKLCQVSMLQKPESKAVGSKHARYTGECKAQCDLPTIDSIKNMIGRSDVYGVQNAMCRNIFV